MMSYIKTKNIEKHEETVVNDDFYIFKLVISSTWGANEKLFERRFCLKVIPKISVSNWTSETFYQVLNLIINASVNVFLISQSYMNSNKINHQTVRKKKYDIFVLSKPTFQRVKMATLQINGVHV